MNRQTNSPRNWMLKANQLNGQISIVALLVSFFALDVAAEQNWPQFLGPSGDGHIDAPGIPVEWSEEENISWKTPIRGRGWSSPVIWNDQIWMGSANEEGTEFYAICVSKSQGEVLYDEVIFDEDNPRFCHDMNSYASPTPVIEDGRVYMHFGSYGTACLDTNNFDVIWSRRDLPCDHFRGPGSSPILYDDMLIVHYDGADHQYVVAFDKNSGDTVWKQDRVIDYGTDNGDIMKAYSTPLVITTQTGETQLISTTSKACLALDPENGDEIWRVRYDEFSATARPVFDGTDLAINTGFGRANLLRVSPDGRGDVTDSNIRWVAARNIGSKPTPLLVDGLLYVLSDQGIASCIDWESGEVIWTERLGGQFSSTPLYSGSFIYFNSHEGESTVIRPGREYDHVATNTLDDGFMSSPAVSEGALFLRSRSHLYRIEKGQ